jgi:hypothetical protein
MTRRFFNELQLPQQEDGHEVDGREAGKHSGPAENLGQVKKIIEILNYKHSIIRG